jgi:hypothetical protein
MFLSPTTGKAKKATFAAPRNSESFARLFPVSLLVLLVNESVLHTSNSNSKDNSKNEKDSARVEGSVKDQLWRNKRLG